MNEWIPCSERMPDQCGTYEVTEVRKFSGPPPFSYRVVSRYFYSPGAAHPWGGVEVIAWRPLPEPWEG